MADNQAVWGIEIGNAGLKAIKLRYAEQAEQVIAVAFDYVPHPKLLSQPDAVPEELIREALATFLSRNQVGSDQLAISLPGPQSVIKFIQLPPVESNKVAEIVKYEARQQIPFPLEDVIWAYQPMGNGMEEGGFLIDAEVGLFAMKREQVEQHMAPYMERKLELELLQIAPLSMFNFLWYDRMGRRKGAEGEGDDGEYTLALDMGCDQTNVVITNGKKIWTRNIALGGNHFTRALTREMKLTFAKAEHLKCNATKSPDPRAVFQAMRPVFNEYVTELQRTIGFFSSVNRSAKVTKLIGLGNGFKLAGLTKFIQQSLQYDIERVDTFHGCVGDNVLAAPMFQDNILTFVNPYGLALQGLGLTSVHTTLLPPEIVVARKIRRKKPWAVATAATLLFGLATSVAGYGNVLNSVSVSRFGEAEKKATEAGTYASGLASAYTAEVGTNGGLKDKGAKLVTNLDTREQWLEVYKAIDECLPRDKGEQLDETAIEKMHRISIKSVTAKKYDDLGTWYNSPKDLPKISPQYMKEADKTTAPTGAGYVITLHGSHFHHEQGNPVTGQGTGYITSTLLKNLQSDYVIEGSPYVPPPGSNPPLVNTGNPGDPVPVGRMGISHATVKAMPFRTVLYWPQGRPNPQGGSSGPGGSRPGGFSPFSGSGPMSTPFSGGPSGGPGSGSSSYNPGFPGSGSGTGGKPRALLEEERGTNQARQIFLTEFTIQFAWKPMTVKERQAAVEAAASGTATDPNAAPAEGAAPADPNATPAPADPNVAPMPGVVPMPGVAPATPAVGPDGQPLAAPAANGFPMNNAPANNAPANNFNPAPAAPFGQPDASAPPQ